MAHRSSNPTSISGSSGISLSLRPRGMRPNIAAQYLGCTPFHIEELMRGGILPFRILGGQRVIDVADLDKYFDSVSRQSGRLSGRGKFLRVIAA